MQPAGRRRAARRPLHLRRAGAVPSFDPNRPVLPAAGFAGGARSNRPPASRGTPARSATTIWQSNSAPPFSPNSGPNSSKGCWSNWSAAESRAPVSTCKPACSGSSCRATCATAIAIRRAGAVRPRPAGRLGLPPPRTRPRRRHSRHQRGIAADPGCPARRPRSGGPGVHGVRRFRRRRVDRPPDAPGDRRPRSRPRMAGGSRGRADPATGALRRTRRPFRPGSRRGADRRAADPL